MLYGLGQVVTTDLQEALHGCLSECGEDYSEGDPRYKVCTDSCREAFPTPGTVTTTSGLPGELAPPPDYVPKKPINWWRVGIGAGMGLAALVVFLGIKRSMRGAGHAA